VKLSNYIVDLGRVVAYYPNLKKITDSTTSSILLCQLLYWCDKTKDQWIWKTSDDIEEETGLTYNEQRTARKNLVDLGIIDEKYARLDHIYKFRVNQEVLNKKWEEYTGKKSEVVTQKETKKLTKKEHVYKKDEPVKAELRKEPIDIDVTKTVDTARTSAVKKKGDIVDGMLAFGESPVAKKIRIVTAIKEKIETRLHINTDNQKWQRFIEFVYTRQEKHTEPVDKFLDWAISQGFDPIYWTPEKMKTVYPQAFIEKSNGKPRKDFVEKLPERQTENYVPMPTEIGRKRDLY